MHNYHTKTEFKKGENRGINNVKWLGDKVGYAGVHTWIYRELGKAVKCSNCGATENVQWANISREYKRDLEDWKQLCAICHRVFDKITKINPAQIELIRNEAKKGRSQRLIAEEYGVHQTTIGNILRGKGKFYAKVLSDWE